MSFPSLSIVRCAIEPFDSTYIEDAQEDLVAGAPWGLELAQRSTIPYEMIQDLPESPRLYNAKLQWTYRITLPRDHIPMILKRSVHLPATLSQDLLFHLSLDLPVYHVVAGLLRDVGMAREVHQLPHRLPQQPRASLHHQLEILLGVLVDVHGQDQLPSAYEAQLGRALVEAGHLHYVSKPVSVKPYIVER